MAAHDVFRRAVQRGLAVLGGREASLLDGAPCGSVAIARGVEVYAAIMDQANDNHVVRADVATIETQYAPKVNSLLWHPVDGWFRLTRLAADNGYSRRFVVVQVPVQQAQADAVAAYDVEGAVVSDLVSTYSIEPPP